jgi:hypothetical protein
MCDFAIASKVLDLDRVNEQSCYNKPAETVPLRVTFYSDKEINQFKIIVRKFESLGEH